MSVKEKFVLKWENFSPTVTASFQEIRKESSLFDINLLVGTRALCAHRLVLSACSPVFRSIIRDITSPNPFIYLKGVRYEILTSILDFMYQGEVSVTQEDLTPFLDLAEELQVRGLTQDPIENQSPTGEKSSEPRVNKSGGPRSLPTSKFTQDKVDPVAKARTRVAPKTELGSSDEHESNKTTGPRKIRTHREKRRTPSKRTNNPTNSSEIVSHRTSPRSTRTRPSYIDENSDGIVASQVSATKKRGQEEEDEDKPTRKRRQPLRYTDSEFVYGDQNADTEPEPGSQRDSGEDTSGSSRKGGSSTGVKKAEIVEDSDHSEDDVKTEISITDNLESERELALQSKDSNEQAVPRSLLADTSEEDVEVLATLSDALEDITRESIMQVPDKSWKCLRCNQLFYLKLSCQNHVESEHLESENHVCPVCIQKFPTIKAVREHVLSGHKKAGEPLEEPTGILQVENVRTDVVEVEDEDNVVNLEDNTNSDNRNGDADDLIEIEQEIPVINL